jgi:hypothetical protein
MPIQNWVTYSMEYFKTCYIPIYLIPDDDFVLLQLDYIGLYFPKIYFYKFGYIKTILSNQHYKMETYYPRDNNLIPNKIVDRIDLTTDFKQYAHMEKINYTEFPSSMFYLLKGDTMMIKKYKKEYQPLIPFFHFLNLDSDYLDLM